MKTKSAVIAASLLLFAVGNSSAALVSYVITGDVLVGDETFPNAFGLTAGDTISATGIFDDSVLTGGTGTVLFDSGSGNSMSISVGTETFTASNDTDFGSGGGPSISLASLDLTDFDYQAFLGTNSAPQDFNSSFTSFDDFNLMFGNWQTDVSITVIPVPAAVWLFGSGLLGLAGIARKRRV